MSSLSDFIHYIKQNNIVRSNRFSISITLPSALVALIGSASSTSSASSNAGSVGITNIISLTCMSADIPGISIHAEDTNYGALPRQVINGRSYDSFSTTFLLSGEMVEKKLFDAWYSTMFNDASNSVNYYDTYVTTIVVNQLDVNDNIIYTFELDEAFPLHIGEIKLDRTSTNQTATLDVNWMFHRIRINDNKFTLSSINTAAVATASLNNAQGSALNNLTPMPSSPSSITSVSMTSDVSSVVGGLIGNVNNIVAQVKSGSISNLAGVTLINAAYKDFNANTTIPTQVNTDVLTAINNIKSQMSNLSTDPSTITS